MSNRNVSGKVAFCFRLIRAIRTWKLRFLATLELLMVLQRPQILVVPAAVLTIESRVNRLWGIETIIIFIYLLLK